MNRSIVFFTSSSAKAFRVNQAERRSVSIKRKVTMPSGYELNEISIEP